MKIKISEATPRQIDYLVAMHQKIGEVDMVGDVWVPIPREPHFNEQYQPTTNPSQGHSILEREIWVLNRCGSEKNRYFEAIIGFEDEPGQCVEIGPTMLIAGLRCFLVSEMGDEAEIPRDFL